MKASYPGAADGPVRNLRIPVTSTIFFAGVACRVPPNGRDLCRLVNRDNWSGGPKCRFSSSHVESVNIKHSTSMDLMLHGRISSATE
jgi:hypothetical protein